MSTGSPSRASATAIRWSWALSELPRKDREWILFTDEQPVVPVYAGLEPHQVRRAVKRKEEPSYLGNFSSARRFVLTAFAKTQSALVKKRVARYLSSAQCAQCHGKRLTRAALSVKFAELDIAEMSRLPLKELATVLQSDGSGGGDGGAGGGGGGASSSLPPPGHPERELVTRRIVSDLLARLEVLFELGLGYLSLERSTPTLSPGELQRLRLATQVRSNLFGVVYVLDEPSAGLHPADTQALLRALDRLKDAGNSLFVVEHELDVIRHADWIVDIGPAAGEQGGRVLYSGPPAGLAAVDQSETARHLFGGEPTSRPQPRPPRGWLTLTGVTANNLREVTIAFPLGVFTSVTGVSGSGKSTLVSQALVRIVKETLGSEAVLAGEEQDDASAATPLDAPAGDMALEASVVTGQDQQSRTAGHIRGALTGVKRLVQVDQKAIGRTPRSNLATYTGLFDHVRRLFARTKAARARGYDAGRFSFNVAKGRCPTCQGEGWVMVELLFLPSVYAPCPACHGARYNPDTLKVRHRGKNIADVLTMTVDAAREFFADEPQVRGSLEVLREVGLGYLRLGQPATELSGGEAQRIKLATELQRISRGDTLYVLDEPTTGLHPTDVERLLGQLNRLVAAGNTVIVVEHDMRVVAGSDWVIDMGPGAGDEGGKVVAAGAPAEVAHSVGSRTAPYLARFLAAAAPPLRSRGAVHAAAGAA